MSPRKRNSWSSSWRLWPAPSVRVAVEAIAKREQQRIAVVIERLIVEGLHARVAAADNVIMVDPTTRI